MDGLEEDGSWPVWLPPWKAPHTDGYGRISRYVTPRFVDELGLGPGYREMFGRAGAVGSERDRRTVEALWTVFISKRIGYAMEPWNPSAGQLIRDPGWLLSRRGRRRRAIRWCPLCGGQAARAPQRGRTAHHRDIKGQRGPVARLVGG